MAGLYKATTNKQGTPQNDARRLASRENFAIFQLKGIISNLQIITAAGVVPNLAIKDAIAGCKETIKEIKDIQARRKATRK